MIRTDDAAALPGDLHAARGRWLPRRPQVDDPRLGPPGRRASRSSPSFHARGAGNGAVHRVRGGLRPRPPSVGPVSRCSGSGRPSTRSRGTSGSNTRSPRSGSTPMAPRSCTTTPHERDEDDLLELVVVRTGQHQFSEVVRDYLKRITYGSDGWASRVRLPSYQRAEVVVDPRIAFGLPLVVHGGARVEDLVDRFVAGDSARRHRVRLRRAAGGSRRRDPCRDANRRLSSSSIAALGAGTCRRAPLVRARRPHDGVRLRRGGGLSGSSTNAGCATPGRKAGSC